MGAACCIAATNKTSGNGSGTETLHRNVRHSPTWSFRWDNRGRVAGEETSVNWFSDGRTDRPEVKYASAFTSEEGSPFEHFRKQTAQKSPASGHIRTPTSDQSISRNISIGASFEEVKETTESPADLRPGPAKLSVSFPSSPSLTTSPPSSLSHQPPATTTPARSLNRSPRHQLSREASDHRIAGLKLSTISMASGDRPVPPGSNESVRDSPDGSSDGWSMHAFSELMAASHREMWSYDNESFGFYRENIAGSSSRFLGSSSVNLQTCAFCSKLLIEKSLWSNQKISNNNELPVAAVLICGHVYHAECLENMTPDTDKYDPVCPVCTYGEKQTRKLYEKILKAEMELKARNKKMKKNHKDGDSVSFDPFKSSGAQLEGSKMSFSSSMKNSFARPFLRRHFSFASKGTSSSSDTFPTRKKGFFWSKSSKG